MFSNQFRIFYENTKQINVAPWRWYLIKKGLTKLRLNLISQQ